MEYEIVNGAKTNEAILNLVRIARLQVTSIADATPHWAGYEDAYNDGIHAGQVLNARVTLMSLGIDWNKQ